MNTALFIKILNEKGINKEQQERYCSDALPYFNCFGEDFFVHMIERACKTGERSPFPKCPFTP